MNIREPVAIGLEQLRSNKLRSFLTLLGMLIGVGAVIGIVSLAEGLRTQVSEQFDRLGGTSLIFVSNPSPWYRDETGRFMRRTHDDHLELEDVERILTEVPHVRTAIPRVNTGGRLSRGKAFTNSPVLGTIMGYQQAMDWYVERGRFIDRTDLERGRAVIVLGTEVAYDLFGSVEPVGKEVKLNGERFDVVGVMEEKRMFDENLGNRVLVPLTTLQRRLTGSREIGAIQVQATIESDPGAVVADIRRVLGRYHRHGEDFRVESAGRQLEEINTATFIMKMVFGGIAGISLLVGGIGIMNIMLVSVTERTREIGIRKAVGAKRHDVLVQFLLEAMVLAMAGGLLGLAAGWLLGTGLAALISAQAGETFTAVISIPAAVAAIIFSGMIGVFFGVYPAVRASRLDPVDALRYE